MNQRFLSFILAAGLFILLWFYIGTRFNLLPKPPPPKEPVETVETAPEPAEVKSAPSEPLAANPAPATAEAESESFEPVIERQKAVLSNELIQIEFDNLGGLVEDITLKAFSVSVKSTDRVHLVSPEDSKPGSAWVGKLDTSARLFEMEKVNNQEIRFSLKDQDWTLVKTFRLGEGYEVYCDVRLEGGNPEEVTMFVGQGLQPIGPKDYTSVSFLRGGSIPPKLTSVSWSVKGKEHNKPSAKIKPKSLEPTLEEPQSIEWVGLTDVYFANVFVPETEHLNFQTFQTTRVMGKEGKQQAVAGVALTGQSHVTGHFFWGPKDEKLVVQLDPKLKNIINYGWAGLLSKLFYKMLSGLYKWTGNWGWSIIILTMLIRLAMMPLTLPSIRSSLKMRAVQPKLEELKKKYKGDDLESKQKLTQETFALYKKEGINPFSSCIIMLPQLPIFIAYFSLLRTAISLRQSPWALWISDLSVADTTYVLPIIMGATMFLGQMATPMPSADPAQQKMMKLMPIFISAVCLGMPSGLILYMITSNLFQFAQSAIVKWRSNKA
ncbi:MAG: membrane protein insertase YidC [Acidobacteria bacterium]|nr:membrane protein insertase YidC [Acidobacteriota bacterium]MCB9396282.1 membrane protein insertase YidC [Acidobacteriota bacterium]